MTLYGDEIGLKPSVRQVEVYIAEKGLYVTPQQVFNYWDRKDWLTKKGTPVKTLEAAISVVNGIVLQKERKKANTKPKPKPKIKETHKYRLYAKYKGKDKSGNDVNKTVVLLFENYGYLNKWIEKHKTSDVMLGSGEATFLRYDSCEIYKITTIEKKIK